MDFSPKDLRKVVVFQNVNDEDLDQIIQNSLTRSIEEDGFFFFQGDAAEYLYVLIQRTGQAFADGPGRPPGKPADDLSLADVRRAGSGARRGEISGHSPGPGEQHRARHQGHLSAGDDEDPALLSHWA